MKRSSPLYALLLLAFAPALLLAQSTPMTRYTPQGPSNTYGECCFDLAVSTGAQYPATGMVSLEVAGPSVPVFGTASTSVGGWSTMGTGTPLVRFTGPATVLNLNLDAFTFCVRRAIGPFSIRCRWFDASGMNYFTRDTMFTACWPDTCHTVKFEYAPGCTWWPSFRNHNPKGVAIDDFHIAIVAPTSATMALGSIPPGWANNGSSAAMIRLRAINPGSAVQLDQLFSQMSFTLNSEPCKAVTIQWWTTSHDTVMHKDSVVCMGRDSLFCCDCVPGTFMRPDTSTCCFTFNILNHNPQNRPIRRVVFTLPVGTPAVFSSAGYTGAQGFSASGVGTGVLTYTGGPVPVSQVAALFDFCIANPPPGPFLIQYSTFDVTPNGQIPLCTFTDTLVCGGCACLHNFQHVSPPLNAPPNCRCYYRFTTLNPQLVDRVVITPLDPTVVFPCAAVPPVTQGGPPTGWTVSGINSSTLTFSAPATHYAPIPICQAAVFEFGMPSGGAVHWQTTYQDGTVCSGIDTLACDTCTCSALFSSVAPIPGVPHCACRYEVKVTSPGPVSSVVFDIPAGAAQFGCPAIVSTDLPGWTVTNTGTQLVFAKGPNGQNIPACREEVFSFGLSSSAMVHWQTLIPGAVVCQGSVSLICDTARCSIGFTKLPSDDKCACKYRVTMTSPSTVNRIAIYTTTPGSMITDIGTTLTGPPDNWTFNPVLPSSGVTLLGGLPIPAGVTRSVDICISAGGFFKVQTMLDNAVVCLDSAYLACDTCQCEIQTTREPSSPNCACLYKLRFRGPALVNRVDVVSNTPGVQILWATMAGWSTTPPLPGNLVTFYGGPPIPACEWRELLLCITGSGSFTVTTWNANQTICRFDVHLQCDSCKCEGSIEAIPTPSVTPPIPQGACCYKLRTLNPVDVHSIKLAILNPGSGAQFVYASMPGWMHSALPAASVSLSGANQQFLPACQWGEVSFCITTITNDPVDVQWETFDASGARVCMGYRTVICRHDTDCCDQRIWRRDVTIQSAVYRSPLAPIPPRVYFTISAFSSRAITRFSVITERAWLTTSLHSPTHRDVTGYFMRAKGNAPSAVWQYPLLSQPVTYTSPILGAASTQLESLGTYAPMGTPVWNHGGPREIKWNNEGLGGYDCTTGPRCILDPAVNGIKFDLAWQPTEMPSSKLLYLHYYFRFEFTDTTCITCWVVREGVVPLRWFSPFPAAALPDAAPQDGGGIEALAADGQATRITMSDRNNGELQVAIPQMSDSLNAFRVVGVALEPEAGVPILSMRDKATSAYATIANGVATIAADIGELGTAAYALQYDNSANRSSFRNTVTLAGIYNDEPGDTLFFSDTLTARVPPGPGDARDSLGLVATGRPTAVHTYAVYLANANAGRAGIARVVLTPKQNAAIIAVGPTEDTAQVAMDGYELAGGRVLLLPAVPGGAVPGVVAAGAQLRPIYLTVSGSVNSEALIGFATIDENGDTVSTGTVTLQNPIATGLRGGDGPDAAAPGTISLAPCYPNPASASATIQFTLRETAASATLTITDASGREVARLLDRALLHPGEHAVLLNTAALPAGTYFYTLASDTDTKTRSFVILR